MDANQLKELTEFFDTRHVNVEKYKTGNNQSFMKQTV